MADRLTAAERSVNMAKIRSGDTKPEMVVRRLLHARGYRYRLHRKDLPGKPDLVFGPRRKAIFIHGCFWHQHDAPKCLDGRKPKSNTGYWHSKLERNVERDRRHLAKLAEHGWEALVIWECQTKDTEALLRQIEAFLGPRPD
jgi:DNA mismatch endonuclease (patch repair protein)